MSVITCVEQVERDERLDSLVERVQGWVRAAIMDATPRGERYARLLSGAGLATAAPAALAGWVDWAEQREQQMHVGLVHAAANVTAVGCYTASLVA